VAIVLAVYAGLRLAPESTMALGGQLLTVTIVIAGIWWIIRSLFR
jgi:hypothetical protein